MTSLYPEIKIDRIKNPSKLYAIPLLGFFIKLIMIIPVGIELWFLSIIQFFMSILNACNIFFRGRYWKTAYEINLGIMQLETNVSFFLFGLTDTYPGFSLKTTTYHMTIDFNKSPNRFFATPLLGVIIRSILLIPYFVYRQIVSLAAFLAVIVSWIFVLFKGSYPETTYEIVRDSVRVDQAVTMYFLGMSDSYPSWWISLNHKTLKIILLVIAAVLTLLSFGQKFGGSNKSPQMEKVHTNTAAQQMPRTYSY